MQKDQIRMLKKALTMIYSPVGDELCGVVYNNNLQYLFNASPTPETGFDLSAEDIIEWMDKSQATWHTHPGGPSNLGGEDFRMFMSWPDHYHFIVGEDGARCYKFDETKNALVELEDEG